VNFSASQELAGGEADDLLARPKPRGPRGRVLPATSLKVEATSRVANLPQAASPSFRAVSGHRKGRSPRWVSRGSSKSRLWHGRIERRDVPPSPARRVSSTPPFRHEAVPFRSSSSAVNRRAVGWPTRKRLGPRLPGRRAPIAICSRPWQIALRHAARAASNLDQTSRPRGLG
jgi:hypothetical protein